MNFFDDLSNLTNEAGNQFKTIKNAVIPVEIQNLKKTHDRLDEEIRKIETENIPADNPQALVSITHLRTFLMTHFGHLMRGGEPEPVLGAKAHPLYIEAKDGYADLDNRLSALELKYQNCSFGYQTNDGQILKPTLDWSEEEWLQIKNSSKEQLAHCWLNTNKNRYC